MSPWGRVGKGVAPATYIAFAGFEDPKTGYVPLPLDSHGLSARDQGAEEAEMLAALLWSNMKT